MSDEQVCIYFVSELSFLFLAECILDLVSASERLDVF